MLAIVIGASAKEAIGRRGSLRIEGAVAAGPRLVVQYQGRRFANSRDGRIYIAALAVAAPWTAGRCMALSKSARLQRAVVFGRVRPIQRRRGARHFHSIGVVALGVVSRMRDLGLWVFLCQR
jgi:hypothetical protein